MFLFNANKLYKLMEDGWNIYIECKGKGREYEMTFEAKANKTISSNMDMEENVKYFYTIHVVSDTLDGLIENLVNKITE